MFKKNSPFYFILFLALTLVVLVESVSIGQDQRPESFLVSKSPPGVIGLVLEDGQTVKTGVDLRAQLFFDTQRESVAGVDVILTFDPQLIALDKIEGNEALFEQFIVNRHDEKSGRVKITAYLPKKPILGEQTLAFSTFRLLKGGAAVLGLEFRGAHVTTDSNLVSQKTYEDLLGRVSSLVLRPAGAKEQ